MSRIFCDKHWQTELLLKCLNETGRQGTATCEQGAMFMQILAELRWRLVQYVPHGFYDLPNVLVDHLIQF